MKVGRDTVHVKGWNYGAHHRDGNGYGVKISAHDRDIYLRREWKSIHLELDGESTPAKVNIDKDSFWEGKCFELISVRIGKWMIKNGLVPWTKGEPPIIVLEHLHDNQFILRNRK